jgi:nitroreductase
MTPFDLETTDRLLSTTRAVRRRLDLDRPVEPEIITQCLELATQAPTGSNRQGWRFIVVTDPDTRMALADLYRKGAMPYLTKAHDRARQADNAQTERVFSSTLYLAENFERVPVHVIPCIESRIGPDSPAIAWASLMGSIFPAVWSFQIALRSRGLGSCLTTLHLNHADEAAGLLGIPDGILQVALLPVAYTIGTDFKPAKRPPAEDVIHWERWSN